MFLTIKYLENRHQKPKRNTMLVTEEMIDGNIVITII